MPAEITACSAQDSSYICTLRVTLGVPVAVNPVLSVQLTDLTFANVGGGDRPRVTDAQRCTAPPLPSPYLAENGRLTRYDLISTGGCTEGAVITIDQAVVGAAKATITHMVTLPDVGSARSTFVLP